MDPNNNDYPNILLNFDKYLEYCVVTQQVWRFKDVVMNGEDYRKVFKALAENKFVEELSIRLERLPSAADARLFIDALQQNTSLLKLTLYVDSDIMNEQMCALLDLLGEKNQLREVFMYDFVWNEQIYSAFLRFLEKSSKLVKLQLPGATFTDEQYLQVLDVIAKHNELLVRTDLGEAENMSDETVVKVAEWINNRPQHILFECYGADSEVSQHVSPQSNTQFSERYDWGPRVVLVEPQPLYLEPNSPLQFWEILPRDMIKKILYQLNIGPLMAFLRSSKVAMALTKQWSFWKDYYLTYFSCVPNECLDTINLVVGEQWLPLTDLTQFKDFDIWREIIRSLVLKRPMPKDFPVNRRELYQRIAGPVLKKYPQLVSELSEHIGHRNRHEISGYGHPALCFVWLYGAAPNRTWYHLGFELMPSGRINGIALLGNDAYLAAENDRFQRIKYIYEWTTASSGEELEEKIAPLIEVLLCGQEFSNGCYWYTRYVNGEIYANIDRILSAKKDQLATSIETLGKQILDMCHVTFSTCVAFTKLIDSLAQQVKDAPEAPAPDYIALKQKTISRAELNKKYCIGERWYNFNKSKWVLEDDEPKQQKIGVPLKGHRREKKVSSAASLQKFIRVCLNYIMMPVLKAFWRLSPKDPEYRVYPHLKTWYSGGCFARWPYVPLEHVSVSHAHPQAWPVIAVAAAQLIISPLCRVIEAVIARTWTNKQQQQQESAVQSREDDQVQTRLDELIGALTRIGLMSNDHLAAIRSLFNKLANM